MTAKSLPRVSTAIEQLNSAPQHRLVLLVAPPGTGKTALLRNWSRQIGNSSAERPSAQPTVKVAWYDIGPTENDPVRFLVKLVSALQRVGLQAARPEIGNLPFESGLVEAINSITLFKDELILVFDHYHHIRAPEIHAAVSLLLDYLPPNAHMVLACQEEPPLPLPRLRARRQMVDILLVDPGLSS